MSDTLEFHTNTESRASERPARLHAYALDQEPENGATHATCQTH